MMRRGDRRDAASALQPAAARLQRPPRAHRRRARATPPTGMHSGPRALPATKSHGRRGDPPAAGSEGSC